MSNCRWSLTYVSQPAMGSRLREGTKHVFDCFLEIVPAREEVSQLLILERRKVYFYYFGKIEAMVAWVP